MKAAPETQKIIIQLFHTKPNKNLFRKTIYFKPVCIKIKRFHIKIVLNIPKCFNVYISEKLRMFPIEKNNPSP